LITLGLVETKPGRGAILLAKHVNPLAHLQTRGRSLEGLQKWALLDLLEVRECLEGKAAQLAADRATREDLVSITRHALEVEKDILAGTNYFCPNASFHLAIARASHNSLLVESIGHVIGQVRDYREHLMKALPDMPKRDMAEHRAILEAIKRRNPAKARRAMVTHMKSFLSLLTQSGELDGNHRQHRAADEGT
jgi:GntR family transcriptional repressor for pyruvate dehydrogenase complex